MSDASQDTQARNVIKPIDSNTVHRITSGQVVIDLRGAVKELVENSLDAGATSIGTRRTHFCTFHIPTLWYRNSIERWRPGTHRSHRQWLGHCARGLRQRRCVTQVTQRVAPVSNLSTALKNTTSKLSTFEDLSKVDTFGFRGEALSSLCALCERVAITTATSAQSIGTVLEFGVDGRLLKSNKKVARQVRPASLLSLRRLSAPIQRGTTVAAHNLFKPYPVRRKELERNLKREVGRLLHLMEAYALVPCTNENSGVRLVLSNQPRGGCVPSFCV
jgi:DNA mismatch repair protein PMS2